MLDGGHYLCHGLVDRKIIQARRAEAMSIPDHEIDEEYERYWGICSIHEDYLPCIHCKSDEADRQYDSQR